MGNRIRQARVAAGLTQLELAQRARMSQQQLSKLERGTNDCSIRRAAALAPILGVAPIDLLPPIPAGGPETAGPVELELLRTFRQLSPDRREMLRAFAKTMLRSEPAAAETGT